MAASSTGRPVTVTVGTVWNLHFEPPPPRPPRLSVRILTTRIVLNVARMYFGVVYFKECPQQPNIPNCLLGMVLYHILMISFETLPCESFAAQPHEQPRGLKACALVLLAMFGLTWILMGDVWVFSIYQPNYDPSAADGLYCNKTLYTFAFWNAVLETFGLGVTLVSFCKGLLCFVNMSPAPGHTDFYRNI